MGSVMNKLPEDVIIQILSRLPVKSLLRFRGVCKAWCNLIKSPDFIAMHFNHPTNEDDHHVLIKRCLQDRATNVLSFHSNTESLCSVLPDLQIPHLNHQSVQLLGPCNGLVCITDYRIIVLCNPTTREFTLLPARPFGCPEDMYCSYNGVGFGFDANTNDYKVIRIVDLVGEDDFDWTIPKVEVYRHSSNSWREIGCDLPCLWYRACFEMFFHGATHWYGVRDRSQKILSLCITTEVFYEFDFPDDCPLGDGNRKSLSVLNESLALILYTDHTDQTDQQFIDVWVMKEYGLPESWTKQFAVGPLSEIDHPIIIWKNSALLIERTDGQLISCSLDTQEIKEFDVIAFRSTLRGLVYKESLVSIKRLCDHGLL